MSVAGISQKKRGENMFEELMPDQKSLKTEQFKHKTNEANYIMAHYDRVTQKPTVKGKSGNI